MSKKPLEIDMCAGSQLRDTQGETLSVDGADITELKKLNDNHGKGFFNSIGFVTESKKILKEDDCENDRHKYYWSKVKAPYLYVRGFLHDDQDHPNARAAAAILRNIHKHDTPLQLKASVEGGVVARGIKDPSLLARTKIHSIALTFTPANNNTLVEPLSLDKTGTDYKADLELIKSVMHLAETNVPSFRHIVRDASAIKIQNNLNKINQLLVSKGQEPLIIPDKKDIINEAILEKITNNIVEINKAVKNLRYQLEPLEKGKKELMAMYRPEQRELATPHVEWANKLPKNNWKEWAVKNHANDPKAFTDQHRQAIEHFAALNHPTIQNVDISAKDSLEDGLNKLKQAEKTYVDSHITDNHYLLPKNEKSMVQTRPNRHWFDLGKSYCEDEGGAMRHCGNAEGRVRTSDNLLSLRDQVSFDDRDFHRPHLTFIVNNGYLGETKGFANQKPDKKYHRDIVELLKDPRIKGIAGGGYEPDNNFEFNDLSDEHKAEVLKANPNLMTKLDQKMLDDPNLPSHHKARIAESASLDPKYYEQLVHDAEPEVRRAMASRPELDPKHHEQLVNDAEPEVRQVMASRPDLDPKHLERLINDKDDTVKVQIAERAELDPKYHEQLVNSTQPFIRSAMAKREDLDPKYHEQLVNDTDDSIRAAMASRPDLDPKHHEQLVNDDSYWVKQALASIPNLDPKYHEQLLNDPNVWIRAAMASRPDLDPKHHGELVNDYSPTVRAAMALRPDLDPKYHEQLVNDTDDEGDISDEGGRTVRAAMASRPDLDPKHLERLMNDDGPGIRYSIARRKNLDPKHLERLVNDASSGIRYSIASREDLDPKHHEQLVNDAEPEVRQVMAERKDLDPKLYYKLAKDRDKNVRTAAGQQIERLKGKIEKSTKKIIDNVKKINNIIVTAKGSDVIYGIDKIEHQLEKGLKGALATGALALGLTGDTQHAQQPVRQLVQPKTPTASTQPTVKAHYTPQDHQEIYQTMALEHPVYAGIGGVETSEGKNYNKHVTISDPESVHFGHTAGGVFGVMPIQGAFILKKTPELAKKYPDLMEAAKNIKMNHKKFTEKFNSDPHAAADFARAIVNYNGQRTKNLEMLLYSWNHGLKGAWNKYHKSGMQGITNDPYVQRALHHMNKRMKNVYSSQVLKHDTNPLLSKALMAGYGGAGAPSALVGGSVMQTESLDTPNKFKYIICDGCGKEQIHAKHQVKCRDCGQSFSFKKIYDATRGTK